MPAPACRCVSIEHLTIDALRPNPHNPRRHSPRQIRQIARSIETFGFVTPIVVDESGGILAGHGRYEAAKLLGLSELPAVRVSGLTEAQRRAFSVADNRLTENSSWDDQLLGEIFNDLAALDLDFSLEVTGFDMAEIDLRIEGLTDGAEELDDKGDALPTTGSVPVSRSGDLWLLGRHRVLCDNALDARPSTP